MGILSESVYQSVPDQPAIEIDWDTINSQQTDFKIEVIADSAESVLSGEDLSKARVLEVPVEPPSLNLD